MHACCQEERAGRTVSHPQYTGEKPRLVLQLLGFHGDRNAALDFTQLSAALRVNAVDVFFYFTVTFQWSGDSSC